MKGTACERGFISLVGLLILSVVAFLGAAAFTIQEKEMETTQRFLRSVPLQMEAQNGILAAVERMEVDASARDNIQAAAGEPVEIVQLQNSSGAITCTVYAKQKYDRVLLLSVSAAGDGRARAVAHIVKRDDRFIIEHWEH
ncbi:MAG: hypothetical protein ACTTH3_04475 [Schwartzia sp. (in: firmicutes)]